MVPDDKSLSMKGLCYFLPIFGLYAVITEIHGERRVSFILWIDNLIKHLCPLHKRGTVHVTYTVLG